MSLQFDRREPDYRWLHMPGGKSWKVHNLVVKLLDEDTLHLLNTHSCGWCECYHASHVIEGTLIPLCEQCRRSEPGRRRKYIPVNSVIEPGGQIRPIKEETPVFEDEEDIESNWDAEPWVRGMEKAEKAWRNHLMREALAGEKTPTPRNSSPGSAPRANDRGAPEASEDGLSTAELIRRRKRQRIAKGRP